MKRLFLTGNGTDVGKTLIAAILCQALGAEYWKPVQCGSLERSDSDLVRELVTNISFKCHPEGLRLKAPMSPHAAAALEGRKIGLAELIAPITDNLLLIEGAGGLMVPLNQYELMLDLIAALEAEVVVVSRNYLGSINHTLLTLEALKARGLPIAGIIFNGGSTPSSEDIIQSYSKIRCLGHVPQLKRIDAETVAEQARNFARVL